MVFPNDLETGVGLAGPTANIGHADAHAAAGIPATLERIQNTIGFDTETKLFTPAWAGTATPQLTNKILWNRIGNVVFVNYEFRWSASGAIPFGTNTLFTNLPAGWGTFPTSILSGRGRLGGSGSGSGTLASLQLSKTSGQQAALLALKSADTINAYYTWESFSANDYVYGNGFLLVTS